MTRGGMAAGDAASDGLRDAKGSSITRGSLAANGEGPTEGAAPMDGFPPIGAELDSVAGRAPDASGSAATASSTIDPSPGAPPPTASDFGSDDEGSMREIWGEDGRYPREFQAPSSRMVGLKLESRDVLPAVLDNVDLLILVARRIAEHRRARGMTQEEFGRALGIATKNVQRLESGRQNLTLRTLETIATVLAVPARVLLEASGSFQRPRELSSSIVKQVRELHDLGMQTEGFAKPGYVPVTTLTAAIAHAGAIDSVDVITWAKVPGRRATSGRAYIARATSDAMEPLVPQSAWCLFGPVRSGSLEGRVLLVGHDEIVLEDLTGAPLRRVSRVEQVEGGVRVELAWSRPENSTRALVLRNVGELRAIGELVRVLAPSTPRESRRRPTR